MKKRIQNLCKLKHVSMNKVESELGFGKGYLSKLGNSKPNAEKLKMIADYFDVSIDYIMTGKEADTKDNSDFDVKKEYERLRDLLKSGKMHPLYFDGIEADEESIDLLLKQVEISLAMIKKDLEKE